MFKTNSYHEDRDEINQGGFVCLLFEEEIVGFKKFTEKV